jgi:hypothetical protein
MNWQIQKHIDNDITRLAIAKYNIDIKTGLHPNFDELIEVLLNSRFTFVRTVHTFLKKFENVEALCFRDENKDKHTFSSYLPCYTNWAYGRALQAYTDKRKNLVIVTETADYLFKLAFLRKVSIVINPDHGQESLTLNKTVIHNIIKIIEPELIPKDFISDDDLVKIKNKREEDGLIIDTKVKDYQKKNSRPENLIEMLRMIKECLDNFIIHEDFDADVEALSHDKDSILLTSQLWFMLVCLNYSLFYQYSVTDYPSSTIFQNETGMFLSLVEPSDLNPDLLAARTCRYKDQDVFCGSYIMSNTSFLTIFFSYIKSENKILVCHCEKVKIN